MSHIRTDRHGGVGVITIDRRERFNAFDVVTAQDFRRAGLMFARDPAARVVVITGTDGVFCSGADLKYIRAGGHDGDLEYLAPGGEPERGYGRVFKQILGYLHSTISEIRRAPKPFIAAVDGIAAAGGFGIAMACDLVVASERATFEWAYGRTGLTGAESSTFLLPRLVGLRRAMGLVLLNPRLDAAAALEAGLVNAVHPTAGFQASVMTVAARVAEGPAGAFAVAKALINQAAGMDRLDHHLERELDALTRCADGQEFAAGLDAFLSKRPAVFRGPVHTDVTGRTVEPEA